MNTFDQRSREERPVEAGRRVRRMPFEPAVASPRVSHLAAAEEAANQGPHVRSVAQMAATLNPGAPPAQHIVQRVLTSEQQAIFDELSIAPDGEDASLFARAQALRADLSDDKGNDPADRKAVGALIAKFTRGGGKKKVVASPSAKEPKPWEWTDERRTAATLMGTARESVMAAALPSQVLGEETRIVGADPRDSNAFEAPVRVRHHAPDPRAAGLGLWAGLVQSLEETDTLPNTLHMLHFPNLLGDEIQVPLSQHASATGSGAPDYFVHDARAPLVMHSTMGLMQGGAPPSAQASAAASSGETLDVSYKAFLAKLEHVKSVLKVGDPQLAEWMLMIVMSPSIAPAVIEDEAPEIDASQLQTLFELVTTWMVAEPVRHASSMLSGIMELELIEEGRRTFQEALVGTDVSSPTHPMSHIGSESQGRDAEQAENLLLGAGDLKGLNFNQVTAKQMAELTQSFGTNAPAELAELVRFYTTEVQQTLGG
jgi:hypothetical protein